MLKYICISWELPEFLDSFFFPLHSAPGTDDVIQPAAPADLGHPPLADSSHHGDNASSVSTHLTVQRYSRNMAGAA